MASVAGQLRFLSSDFIYLDWILVSSWLKHDIESRRNISIRLIDLFSLLLLHQLHPPESPLSQMPADANEIERNPSPSTIIDVSSYDNKTAATARDTALTSSDSSLSPPKLGGLSLLPSLKQRSGSGNFSTIKSTVRSASSSTAPLRIDTGVTGSQITGSPPSTRMTELASVGGDHLGPNRPPTLKRAETDSPKGVTYSPGSSLYRSTLGLSPLSKQNSIDAGWTSTTVNLNNREPADRFWDAAEGTVSMPVRRSGQNGSGPRLRSMGSMGSFDGLKASWISSSPRLTDGQWFDHIASKRTKAKDKHDAEMFAMIVDPAKQVGEPVIGIPAEPELGSDEDSGAEPAPEPEPAPEAEANRSSLEKLEERFSMWGKN